MQRNNRLCEKQKIDNYEELVDCVNIIAEILQAYHQPTDSINVIQSAIQNMIDRTALFFGVNPIKKTDAKIGIFFGK